MNSLLPKIINMQSPQIVVIGDFMLDEIVLGDAERLSPDAPVPVLEMRSTQSHAGGAGNVAKCMQAMGAHVTCLGVIGDDKEGETLLSLLSADGLSMEHMLKCDDRPTTVKRSFVGLAQHRHPQKMFRLDCESNELLSKTQNEQLLGGLKDCLASVDVVCVEDYGKGVISEENCQAIIQCCQKAGVEVIIDPAGRTNYDLYSGATAITPNRTEAEKATGQRLHDDEPIAGAVALAAKIFDSLDLEAAILTLDKHGSVLKEKGCEAIHLPTRARDVYDVTGAGDMVLAAIAVGRAAKLDWLECVEFANIAAGLEVELFGATPIPIEDIQLAILNEQADGSGKIRTLEELQLEILALKQSGKKIILTNGCFDVIHAGHVSYLREAATKGDILIVGVNSDEQVKAQKGSERPIYSLSERMEILAELQCVSFVTSFIEPTAEHLIQTIQPNLYVKGGDYAMEDIKEVPLLEELKIPIELLSHRPGRSSTETITQMREQS